MLPHSPRPAVRCGQFQSDNLCGEWADPAVSALCQGSMSCPWRGICFQAESKEEFTMSHFIEFNAAFIADVEISPKHRMERVRIRKGNRAYVGLRPYVVESAGELFEVADLYFEDGTVTRRVPYARFHFVD
jgi:hypothetical protein